MTESTQARKPGSDKDIPALKLKNNQLRSEKNNIRRKIKQLEAKLSDKDNELTLQIQKTDELSSKLQEQVKIHASRKLHDEIAECYLSNGGVNQAVTDVINRSRSIFNINDDGEIEITAPGVTSAQDWVEADLKTQAPHLFPTTKGVGALGNFQNNNTPTTNPFMSENLNLTEQARLKKQNPARAKQLAAHAE